MNIFQYKWLLFVFLAIMLFSGCTWQNSHGSADLIPTSCHREFSVGMLFVTVENHGNDAVPSVMSVTFNTSTPMMRRVQLAARTPEIPSQEARTLAIDLPYLSASSSFVLPTGKVTITADATKALSETHRAHTIRISMCSDAR